MTTWWNELNPRERLAVSLLGLVFGIVLFILLIVRPLLSWRADEAAALREAEATYAMLGRAVASQSVTEGPSGTALRATVTETARRADINLVSIRRDDEDQSVFVTTGAVGYPRLAAWLVDLEQGHGVQVISGAVRKAPGADQLTAQLTLAAGG